ncbi:MAG: hypothetical protein AB8B92_07010 [Gammaproteobacteria bacterium]
MIRLFVLIAAIIVFGFSSTHAEDKTPLCEHSIGGIGFNQSHDEVHSFLSTRFEYDNSNHGPNKRLIDFKTYEKYPGPGAQNRDSEIIFSNSQPLRGRISIRNYIKIPKDNIRAWKSVDWEYGKYVQAKMARLCTAEVSNISFQDERAMPPTTPGVQKVRCFTGQDHGRDKLEIIQTAPKESNSSYQCKYSISIVGARKIEGGDGQDVMLVFEESMSYRFAR